MNRARVIHVDFAAWGQASAKVRALCGPVGFVDRRAAEEFESYAEAFAELARHVAPDGPPQTERGKMLPGMAEWLRARRP